MKILKKMLRKYLSVDSELNELKEKIESISKDLDKRLGDNTTRERQFKDYINIKLSEIEKIKNQIYTAVDISFDSKRSMSWAISVVKSRSGNSVVKFYDLTNCDKREIESRFAGLKVDFDLPHHMRQIFERERLR